MHNWFERGLRICNRSLLFATALVLGASIASAAEWRLSTSYKPGSEADQGSRDFVERVREKSNGRVDIQVYPASQLGDWTEVYEQVMSGAIEMTMGAVPTTFDKRLAIDSFPYAVTDYAEAARAYAPGGYLYEIVDDIVAGQGVKILSTWAKGMGGGAFTELVPDPLNPDAAQKMKVRVWPGGVTHRALMERFGFTVTMIPWDEVYTALQTGVADGVIGGNPELTVTNFKDIAKMYVQYNDHFENHYIMMNKDLWESLSAEDQAAVLDAAVEVMDERFPLAEQSDEAYMQQLRDAGIEVVTLDSKKAAEFAAVARRDVWPSIKDEIGDELYERLRQELGLQ
ncbi:MAG: TRAP transporter substrate-binding protein DctP [Kiloniellales bacterium]|nr:TRAP transporter substrate-binding protein DctP [Kiloniellales bacterium]